MTKEEAIEMIRDDIKKHHDYISGQYRKALNMAIKALEQEPCEDSVSRQAAIEAVSEACFELRGVFGRCKDALKALPSAQPEQQWVPIKWHDCTDEDREKYGFSNDIVAVFDCEMPDDDQPILVTTSYGYVNQDVCYIDDGYSLDSGWDWIDDIKAWMPLPEPYTGGNQMKEICKNCADCKPTYKGGYCDRKNKKVKQSDTCYEWRPKK